jgi:hypothetical protein
MDYLINCVPDIYTKAFTDSLTKQSPFSRLLELDRMRNALWGVSFAWLPTITSAGNKVWLTNYVRDYNPGINVCPKGKNG